MNLFPAGKLNPALFDAEVRRWTHDLSDVLLAAAETQSAAIESTHFLSALANVPDGATVRGLRQRGLGARHWQDGLRQCIQPSAGALPPAHLSEQALAPSAVAMLRQAAAHCERLDRSTISEAVLLLAALGNATPAVRQLCHDVDLDVDQWCAELEDSLRPIVPIELFEAGEPGALRMEAFTPAARKALALMRTEAESLGYPTIDPRHLLLALLEREGGALHYGLHHQQLKPRKVQEAVALNLQNKARRQRAALSLDRRSLQPLLQRIVAAAGEAASRDRQPLVAEVHLLRGLLSVESSAGRILADEKVSIPGLLRTAEAYEAAEEIEEDEAPLAAVETVRTRLAARLVGQDDAIERILPYVELMRFGFSTPGRPVGVFLFCGQSGSGKTQLAKELARAVYGSEESLIFLEMGQFNAPESMNIFVGAPPGYVGYGEGKLTNGLRDKPRAVVLFDEVEKAHSKVLDALLRFLDEGRIDDPAGPVRDGSGCIVILTSNVGSAELSRLWDTIGRGPEGQTQLRQRLREEFRRHEFRVEFLNRVDEVVLFHELREPDYVEIARRQVADVLATLRAQRQVEVQVDPAVTQAIGLYCSSISEGARAVPRLMNRVVVLPVGRYVVQHQCRPPVRLRVRLARKPAAPDAEPEGAVEMAP